MNLSKLIVKESELWGQMPTADYSIKIVDIFNELNQNQNSEKYVEILFALVSEILRRKSIKQVEAKFQCAKSLLLSVPFVPSEDQLRIRLLLLLAWYQLWAVVDVGPDSVSVNAALPPDVVLPDGADLENIVERKPREQAQKNKLEHSKSAELWNDKQLALDYLREIAKLLQSIRLKFTDEEVFTEELLVAMSSIPGLPEEIQRLLKV